MPEVETFRGFGKLNLYVDWGADISTIWMTWMRMTVLIRLHVHGIVYLQMIGCGGSVFVVLCLCLRWCLREKKSFCVGLPTPFPNRNWYKRGRKSKHVYWSFLGLRTAQERWNLSSQLKNVDFFSWEFLFLGLIFWPGVFKLFFQSQNLCLLSSHVFFVLFPGRLEVLFKYYMLLIIYSFSAKIFLSTVVSFFCSWNVGLEI